MTPSPSDPTPTTEATTELESLRITNGSDPRETDPTPTTPPSITDDPDYYPNLDYERAMADLTDPTPTTEVETYTLSMVRDIKVRAIAAERKRTADAVRAMDFRYVDMDGDGTEPVVSQAAVLAILTETER